MTELAKRAIACRHWRWMPGMRAERWTGPCYGTYRYSDHDVRAHRWWPGGLPDLNDPATLGCLLALVREAWDVGGGENKYAYIAVHPPVAPHVGEPWSVVVCDHTGEWPFRFDGDREAEALVAALEAAP